MSKNVFVMASKLTSVGGRRDYISSPDRQENLLATYSTNADEMFWKKLADQNQQQFLKTGQGNRNALCGEAKELIIALPKEEKLRELDYSKLAKEMAEDFKKIYGVECEIGVHYNKEKNNLHAHLIFAERKELKEPVLKYADRKIFIDEKGIRKRTKKEIQDEDRKIRHGCKVIEKGELISAEYFDKKIDKFKTKGFLIEAKEHYAKFLSDISLQEYKVFDRTEPYLPTKHIGKGRGDYMKGMEQRNSKIIEYNNLAKAALEQKKLTPEEALKFKQETNKEIREASKISKFKTEIIEVLKQKCEKLKSIIAEFRPKKIGSLEMTTEEFAKEMNAIRGVYRNLSIEIESKTAAITEGNRSENYLIDSAKRVIESANEIRSIEYKIKNLREQQRGLGIFKGKEKRALDEQIASLIKSREKAIEHHRDIYNSEPDQSTKISNEYLEEAKQIRKTIPERSEIERLKTLRERAEINYKTELLWLEQRPDNKQIEPLLKKIGPSAGRLSMDRQISEAKLNQITKLDLDKIRKMNAEKHDVLNLVNQKELSIRKPVKSQNHNFQR